MKHKLNSTFGAGLSPAEWSHVGKDPLMANTVLDDIYQKYIEYQKLTQKHKGVLEKQAIQQSESVGSLDSIDSEVKHKKKYGAPKPVDKAKLQKRLEDSMTVLKTFEKSGRLNQTGRMRL